MARKWFQLVGEDGNALTSAAAVVVDIEDVDALRDAVFAKVSRSLPTTVISADLTVFDANGVALGPRDSLAHIDENVTLVVQVPKKEQRSDFWLVTGTVVNARSRKGVRCRLYRLAGSYLGLYDPARHTGDKDSALWYEDNTLHFHILFKDERDAHHFMNAIDDETLSIGSALHGAEVTTSVVKVALVVSNQLERISFKHYVAQESDSPQQTMSSLPSTTSIIDVMTDEFRYQRIEAEECFGSIGKAESCHLISAAHCREYETYKKYDGDPNNRLALSRDLHGFYDGLNVAVPVMNIFFESASPAPVIDDRYEVKLVVRALDFEYGQRISSRLKEGSIISADGMEMRTSVFVKEPKVFRKCLEWKAKQIEKAWKDYFDMTPAAN